MSQIRFDASAVAKAARRNQSPYWGEHSARYVFASSRVSDRSVLDVACGTGFGLPVLLETARLVVGADVDLGAVRKALAEVDQRRAICVAADGCKLPFSDASFEAITSFETLEHLQTRSEFLHELRRVLKPNGVCIISTPNANYTQPVNGKPRNPFHVFEYTPDEFIVELKSCFDSIDLFGQNLDSRFAISPFWDDQQRLPRTFGIQSRLLLWRMLNKMPARIRDSVSSTLWGHTFYPGETDYQFDEASVETAPVLVAVCRTTREIKK